MRKRSLLSRCPTYYGVVVISLAGTREYFRFLSFGPTQTFIQRVNHVNLFLGVKSSVSESEH